MIFLGLSSRSAPRVASIIHMLSEDAEDPIAMFQGWLVSRRALLTTGLSTTQEMLLR